MSMIRLRLGITLIILSWLPFAQLLLLVAHNGGKLTSESASSTFRLIVWGIQIVIGFVGLWLAGQQTVAVAKQAGWKKAPKIVWELFRYGDRED